MAERLGFYFTVYERLPEFLKRRINPLEYSIRSFVESASGGLARSVVLDAGSGESRFAPSFRRHLYIALDLGVGDPAWDYSKVGLLGDLSAIPLDSETVDIVLNIQVLEHVMSPSKVLAEIHRVLKPGGTLYLTAPQGWGEHQSPHDYFRFTRDALRLLFLEAGFRDPTIEAQGGYFHYLGHRLTYVPKVLFAGRSGLARVLLFPLEVLSLAMFCLCLPVVCYYFDRLDSKREFTLGYQCMAVKGTVSPSEVLQPR